MPGCVPVDVRDIDVLAYRRQRDASSHCSATHTLLEAVLYDRRGIDLFPGHRQEHTQSLGQGVFRQGQKSVETCLCWGGGQQSKNEEQAPG